MAWARMLLLKDEPVMMQAETPAFFALSITASLSCIEQLALNQTLAMTTKGASFLKA